MAGRINVLRALGGTNWGWYTSDRRQVYIAIERCILEYAASALTPWLSATSTSRLEKVQMGAARAITSLVRTTPVEAVLAESQLPPISTRYQTISPLKADEWAIFHRMQTAPEEKRQTQFICLNQLRLSLQFLPLTPLP